VYNPQNTHPSRSVWAGNLWSSRLLRLSCPTGPRRFPQWFLARQRPLNVEAYHGLGRVTVIIILILPVCGLRWDSQKDPHPSGKFRLNELSLDLGSGWSFRGRQHATFVELHKNLFKETANQVSRWCVYDFWFFLSFAALLDCMTSTPISLERDCIHRACSY